MLITGIILLILGCMGFGATITLSLIVLYKPFRNYIREEIDLIEEELKEESSLNA